MAFTQQDLDSIDRAIASGEMTISQNGRTVTYRSIDDLRKARSTIAQALQGQSGTRPGIYRFSNQTLRGM